MKNKIKKIKLTPDMVGNLLNIRKKLYSRLKKIDEYKNSISPVCIITTKDIAKMFEIAKIRGYLSEGQLGDIANTDSIPFLSETLEEHEAEYKKQLKEVSDALGEITKEKDVPEHLFYY